RNDVARRAVAARLQPRGLDVDGPPSFAPVDREQHIFAVGTLFADAYALQSLWPCPTDERCREVDLVDRRETNSRDVRPGPAAIVADLDRVGRGRAGMGDNPGPTTDNVRHRKR